MRISFLNELVVSLTVVGMLQALIIMYGDVVFTPLGYNCLLIWPLLTTLLRCFVSIALANNGPSVMNTVEWGKVMVLTCGHFLLRPCYIYNPWYSVWSSHNPWYSILVVVTSQSIPSACRWIHLDSAWYCSMSVFLYSCSSHSLVVQLVPGMSNGISVQ